MESSRSLRPGQPPIAVLLLGGASRRFWPLEDKPLLDFCGLPLIVHQLHQLRDAGITDAVLVTSPAASSRLRELLEGVPGLHGHIVVQQAPAGMGDALLCAAPLLEREYRGRVLYVTQPNDIVDASLHRRIVRAAVEEPGTGLLTAVARDRYFPGGYLVVEDGRVRGIIEKPPMGQEPSNLVTIVAHVHPHASALLAALEEEYATSSAGDDHYERAVARLLRSVEYRAFLYDGPWAPLKFPWHVLDALELFLRQITEQRIAESARISPRAEITGPVVIAEDVRVFSGAHIVGPAYIGRGAIIGDNTLVRESQIGEGSVVGFNTEVARSYIGRECWFHSNYIGDSVIGDAVSFGAGAVTANLRFDEQPVATRVGDALLDTGRVKLGAIVGRGSKIGVNATILPGVKIGAGTWVSPGLVVRGDIPDGVYLTPPPGGEMRPNRAHSGPAQRDAFRQRLLGAPDTSERG
jgi:NDP-sugar pyrophosphorylase family protein